MNKYLYKYKTYNKYSKSELENKEIWISHPSLFNDPFDCLKPIELMKKKINGENLGLDSDYKKILNAIRLGNYGILSLTPINNNSLMWAHYTDSHKGFAYEFEFNGTEINKRGKKYYKSFNNDKSGAVKVSYSIESRAKELPSKDEILKNPIKLLDEGIFKKSNEWKYEDEYRFLFVTNDDGFIDIIIKKIKDLKKNNKFHHEFADKLNEFADKLNKLKVNIGKGIDSLNDELVKEINNLNKMFSLDLMEFYCPVDISSKNKLEKFINEWNQNYSLDIEEKSFEEILSYYENFYSNLKKDIDELRKIMTEYKTSKKKYKSENNFEFIKDVKKILDNYINSTTKGGLIEYEKKNYFKLKSIIFGMKMEEKEKKEIIKVVKKSWGEGVINFKQVVEIPDSLDIEVIPYKI